MDLETFRQTRRDAIAAVVMFTSTTCGPCKRMYPVFDELKSQAPTGVIFLKIDTGKSPEVASYCEIGSVPTFRFYVGGQHAKELMFVGADVDRLVNNCNEMMSRVPTHLLPSDPTDNY